MRVSTTLHARSGGPIYPTRSGVAQRSPRRHALVTACQPLCALFCHAVRPQASYSCSCIYTACSAASVPASFPHPPGGNAGFFQACGEMAEVHPVAVAAVACRMPEASYSLCVSPSGVVVPAAFRLRRNGTPCAGRPALPPQTMAFVPLQFYLTGERIACLLPSLRSYTCALTIRSWRSYYNTVADARR